MPLRTKLALIGFLLGTGCSFFTEGSVKVHNRSKTMITGVSVKLAGQLIDGGQIVAGAAHIISGNPKTDGTMQLAYVQGGKPRLIELGYVTPGLNLSCQVWVDDNSATKACETR